MATSDDRARRETAHAADDVHELLHAHVRAEPGLRDDDVAELERDPVGDERVVAVGDVRERPAVDERGLTLERLHEVRLDRLLEQHGHRAGGLQLLRRDRLAVAGRADRDAAEPFAQVVEVARDGDDRHHLGGGGDVAARLAGIAVRAPAQADHGVAQRAVVDVDAAPPGDRERVDPELVAVEQMGLEHGGEQVVRGADGMDVAGEVEVHVLHRHDLRVAGAGCSALDPEHRAERRLAQAEHRLAADRAQALRQRDRGGRLPLAELRRRDRGHADELRVGPVGEPVEHREGDLGLVPAVGIELVGLEPCRRRDLRDRVELGVLCNLERGRCRRRHACFAFLHRQDVHAQNMSNISVWRLLCSPRRWRIAPTSRSAI